MFPVREFNYRESTEIIHGLFLGSMEYAFGQFELYTKSIKHVVSTVSFNQFPSETDEKVKYYFIPMDDTEEQDLLLTLNKTYDIIFNCLIMKKENTLVRCQSGISRSASIVIGFLMRHYSYSYVEADRLVRQKCPTIEPNINFKQQLAIYEFIKYQPTMSNIFFKQYLFTRFVMHKLFKKENYRALFLNELEKEEIPLNSIKFKCKICRNILFYEKDVIRSDLDQYRILPTKWMFNNSFNYFKESGKLYCEKCLAKIGHVNWNSANPERVHFYTQGYHWQKITMTQHSLYVPIIFSINAKKIDKIDTELTNKCN